MRIGIISGIHGNRPALDAVLHDIEARSGSTRGPHTPLEQHIGGSKTSI